ncbi:hypothetical protein GQ55_6G290400 [Panicum hallii var. hallii]|uniref:Chlorophyllase n=1 Tax=Panicum hallii var. hallii TaxID=1504633 RepID=A0A2T7DAS2_9POAL|nr:hypothetical protein GQ55_6G290400 [Panicum hallii var. hallii]
MAAVFEDGPLQVVVQCVRKCEAKDLPKPLVVATPTNANTYPVVVFLHGWNMCTWWYRCLLKHVASHGFIVVAPQLHEFLNFSISDADDIEATKAVTNWLATNKEEEQHAGAGLLHVLRDILKVEGVKPDLSRVALAGHSRGGDTAFAVALGLKGRHVRHPISLDVNFSALVGVDPVGGVAVELGWLPPLQWTVEPSVLTGPFDPRMPVLVVGTGLGPEGLVPCAPAGMNHVEFYKLCQHSPRYHFAVKDYGHVDMLDDDEPPFPLRWCPGNDDHTGRELCRKTMGGLMVAFLWDKLEEGRGQDLQAVLQNPGIAPALLDQVEQA